jgi:hypothetical protein
MFDAYKVAVTLKLKDEFTGVMGLIIKQLGKADMEANKLHASLAKCGKLFSSGMMVAGAGYGMAMVLKASTNEAVRYEQQLNKLKALNLDMRFGAGTTDKLESQAKAISAGTKGTSITEALKLVTETQAITGDTHHTAELAPLLAKMKFGIETYMSSHGHGAGKGDQAMAAMTKVMEMSGLMRNFSLEKAQHMADMFTKNFVASGGMVKPQDFLAMMKTGGVAAKSVNEDFMFALGHIMQEKGGNRAGTQLMSLYQNLVAGRTTQQVAEHLMSTGLLKASGVHYGKTGHITKVDFGALKAAEMMQANPLDFLNKMILPALAAKGININDSKKVIPQLAQLASNRTGADFLAQLYLERGQIANYVEQAKGAAGVNQLNAISGKSTTGQQSDLRAQVDNLELALGTASLPLLKSLLEQAIPLVKSLGSWMDSHPDGLANMAKGFGLLSAAMMISGPLMVLTSGLKGMNHVLDAMSKGGGATGKLAGGMKKIGNIFLAYEALEFAAKDVAEAAATGNSDSYRLVSSILSVITGKDQNLGEWIYDKLHKETTAAEHDAALMANIKPMQHAPIQVKAELHVDGRKMAENTTYHQAREASRPQSAQSGFDGSMNLRPVGANGGW